MVQGARRELEADLDWAWRLMKGKVEVSYV
jgi:hypothetical protein